MSSAAPPATSEAVGEAKHAPVVGPVFAVLIVVVALLLSCLANDSCPVLGDRVARRFRSLGRWLSRYCCCCRCGARRGSGAAHSPSHSTFFASNTRWVPIVTAAAAAGKATKPAAGAAAPLPTPAPFSQPLPSSSQPVSGAAQVYEHGHVTQLRWAVQLPAEDEDAQGGGGKLPHHAAFFSSLREPPGAGAGAAVHGSVAVAGDSPAGPGSEVVGSSSADAGSPEAHGTGSSSPPASSFTGAGGASSRSSAAPRSAVAQSSPSQLVDGRISADDEVHVLQPPSRVDRAWPSEPSEPPRRSPSPEYISARTHFSTTTQSHSRCGSSNSDNAGQATRAAAQSAADGGGSIAPAGGPGAPAAAALPPAGPAGSQHDAAVQKAPSSNQGTSTQPQPRPSPQPDPTPAAAPVLGGGAYAVRPREFWAFDVLDPAHLVSSFWVRPSMLLALHVLTALYLTAVLLLERFEESNLGPWWVTFFTDWAIAVFGFSAALAAVNTARYLPLLAASAPRPDNSPSRTNWGSSLASKGAFPHGHTQQGGGATEEAADIEQGRRAGHGLRRNPSSSSGRSGGSSGTRPRGPLGAAVHALSRAAAMAAAATATGVAAATAHGKPSRSTHSDTALDQHQQQMRRQPAPSTSEAAEHTSSAGPTPGGDDLQATDQHCKGHGDDASRVARNSSPQRRRAEGGSAEPAESPHDRSSSEQAHPHAAILERLARAAPVGPLAAAAAAVQQSAVGGEGAMGRGGGGGGSGGQQDWRAAFQPLGSHVAAGAGLTELPRSSFNSAGSPDVAGGAPDMSGAGPGPEPRPQAEARARARARARAGAGAGADTMVAADSAEANEEKRDGGRVGHTAPQGGGAKPSARAASGAPPAGAAEAQVEPTVPRLQWDALSVAHCLGLEVSVVTALFVTIVYWVGLVGLAGESFNARSAPNYMKHAANSGMALMHVMLTRLPLVSVHFTAFLLFLASYCVFLWIYGEVSGVWRYGLNWTTPRGVAGEVVLVVLALLVFLCWYGVARVREHRGRLRVIRVGDFAFVDTADVLAAGGGTAGAGGAGGDAGGAARRGGGRDGARRLSS